MIPKTHQFSSLMYVHASCKLIRKIYEKIKNLYKNFVILISHEMIEHSQMFPLEKEINDIMEAVTFYLN